MNVFVCDTLTDRDEFRGAAELDGLHRVDGAYPTLVPGGTCDGRVLSTPKRETFDRYEGVDRGRYVRCSLPVAGGGTVACYVGDPAALDAPDEWPGTEPFPGRYLDASRVPVDTR